MSSALRWKKGSMSPRSVSASAKSVRASRIAWASRAVLSIMPLFLWAMALPTS
jgi:hypothetical protein